MALSALPFLALLSRVDYSLLFTNRPVFVPNFLFVTANLFGFIGALCFFWQILIGTRHFTKFLTSNTVWVNKLHRILGTYGIVFILAHPLLEAYNYLQSIPWIFSFSFGTEEDTHISLGRIALLLFLIIWITSAILRKNIKFRPWKYIHYLSYPLMGFVFIHAFDLGTFLSTIPWVRAYWIGLLITYLLIVAIRLMIGGGLGKKIYKLTHVEHIGDSIIILHLLPSSAKKIQPPRIGQYAYIQLHRFKEAHPFTIMDYNESTGELIFGIRILGNFTRTLNTLTTDAQLLVDGPYGTFTAEAQNSEQKIVIAGGIGITPFVRLAKSFGKGMTFIACSRTIQDVVWRETLMNSAERYVDVIEQADHSPELNMYGGRLNLNLLKQILNNATIPQLPYFICGSPIFITIMKKTLTDAGVSKEQIYAEELGF